MSDRPGRVPALQQVPPDVVCLPDYAAHARDRLDDNAWAYLAGAAADEITLRANRAAWDQLALVPRVLRRLSGGHTRVELLGRTLAHPLLLAPVAYQRLAHPDGELASAHAAAAQGAGFILSAQASVLMEDVAQAVLPEAERGPLWFQLYMQHDRGFTRELVQRAEAAGYEAIVLTVDAPSHGVRDRERRAQLKLPEGVSAVNLAGLPPAPRTQIDRTQSWVFDALMPDAPTWDEIDTLRSHTRLPLLLKGVMHPEDAREAQRQQVAGLIVSNHGGRTLDTAAPTAWVLPRIADAVGDALPLLVDGGIQRGTDVLKALALGARAVLIGRPYMHALATCGAIGVAHVLRVLRDELEVAMALCGCRTVADAGRELFFEAPW